MISLKNLTLHFQSKNRKIPRASIHIFTASFLAHQIEFKNGIAIQKNLLIANINFAQNFFAIDYENAGWDIALVLVDMNWKWSIIIYIADDGQNEDLNDYRYLQDIVRNRVSYGFVINLCTKHSQKVLIPRNISPL